MSLTANLEKAREKTANAKAEWDKLRVLAELVSEENQATPSEMRENWQGDLDSLKAMVLEADAAIAKVRKETSSGVT